MNPIIPTPQAPAPEFQPRLLLVDDEPRLLSSLYELLRVQDSYQLVTATNGAEVLAALSRQQFDLLLLDCRMPGAGAEEVLAALRQDPEARSSDCTAVATSAEMDKTAWHERIATVLRDGYAPFIDGVMVPRWFTPGFAAAHPDVVAGFKARMMANDTAGYAACANVIATLDLPARIAAITAPTIIIVGAEDPATPVAMSERIRSLVPHAEMVVIPGAGHNPMWEKPDDFDREVLAFLRG